MKAYEVLYKKGPVILNELMKNIGEETFEELLKQIHLTNINTTEGFLSKLEELCDKEIGVYFENLLIQ